MKYLFDTDHISFLQRRSGPEYAAIQGRIAQHTPSDFGFCVISFHEQSIGAHTYIQRARNNAGLIRGYSLFLGILRGFIAAPVLPFNAAVASVLDSLRSQGIRLGAMDLRIAAIALAHDLILLTRNTADFVLVPGLNCEDWTA
ncbi:MAG: type II toxin-antitoxin system VapC family toxin [Planctomycetes bacterium]|nr:type II toxin-antitoxin system VapC family toxin [Planctomycetota bacterium]